MLSFLDTSLSILQLLLLQNKEVETKPVSVSSQMPFVTPDVTPTIHTNPLLSLSVQSYSRLLWNEILKSIQVNHPSSKLVSCLLDALSLTYRPSGDFTEVFAILLSISIKDGELLSHVLGLMKDVLANPDALFLELYSLTFPSILASNGTVVKQVFWRLRLLYLSLITGVSVLILNSHLYLLILLFLLKKWKTLFKVCVFEFAIRIEKSSEECEFILSALGRCLQQCPSSVCEKVYDSVVHMITKYPTPQSLFSSIPSSCLVSTAQKLLSLRLENKGIQLLDSLYKIHDISIHDVITVCNCYINQGCSEHMWNHLMHGLFSSVSEMAVPLSVQIKLVEQYIEQLEENWTNTNSLRFTTLLLASFTSYPLLHSLCLVLHSQRLC